MPLKTTIVVSKTASDSVENPSPRPPGYRLDLAVTDHTNITNKIFVMQREQQTADSADYESTFYSVASVADLEELPLVITTGEPFYLVSSISLIFRTMDELLAGAATIEILINQLVLDNDKVINGTDPTLVGFPVQETLLRYWGIFSGTTVTDENLAAFFHDDLYSRTLDVEFVSDEMRYVYFAYRAELGAPTTFKVEGADETPILVTRAVVNERGYSTSYRIYRSTNRFIGLAINFSVS